MFEDFFTTGESFFPSFLDFCDDKSRQERNIPKSNPRTFYDLLSISLRFELDQVTRKVVAYIDGCADDTDPVTKSELNNLFC
ncbi:hypothetical protein BYT27DRAFT_7179747 [Phlegmacium glaucopus]|nr:hypothetical protein BYT27DRAFT_7179747 [Phlegmacium glaucopus]